MANATCEYCGQPIQGQSVQWQGHQFDSEGCRASFQRDQGENATAR